MITKIYNIKSLITYDKSVKDVISKNIDSILIKDDKIYSIDYSGNDIKIDKEIDANNSVITPGFIDSHTHLIFSSNRANDFNRRISGDTYLEISKSGGGIKSSIDSIRKSSKNEILNKCRNQINHFIRNGTTTIEAKSGYGLTLKDEIKSLEIIKELNYLTDIDLIPTFMGAHDFPNEIKERSSYVDLICDEMIPEVSSKKLAEFCDVFCENGYFDHDQTIKISESSKKYGLTMKLHADEFEDSNAAYLAGEIKAISADHLMKSNLDGLKNMAKNNVIATLLPATTLFLGMKTYANGRAMIDVGCDVAIASDYNPGSNTIYSLPSIMALSCLYCGLSINESFKAVTYNAAKSINRENSIGLIEKGYTADILFWDIDNINEIPYWFNSDRLSTVIKNGKLIFQNDIN